ncbi:MAG: Gfo/Idh/MocA family oxidoreductase [Gaiellaceae bacterium MAG52_C11]|nr:Gfo/Idh/MocA family oxidoreductase [Candidatus Gaiellasilicea maunaloa]
MHAANASGRTGAVELVGVADAVEDVARSTGERLDVAWTTSFDELLAMDVEGVLIATPTGAHAGMIECAAAAGKHVLCEKPIALDLDASVRAIERARSAGVKLQVGFHRRFDPDWAAVAAKIAAGELGDVYLFRTSLRDKRSPGAGYLEGSGGFFVDVSIHDLDTARWMVGEIDEVTAIGGALSDPAFAEAGDLDNAVVTLRFTSGALGVIDNSRAAGYGYECSTEVMGSLATARIGYHRRVNVEWLTPGSQSVDWVNDFTERYPDAYLLELEGFAAAIRDDYEPAVGADDALAAFVLADACGRSFREGRPIRLEHENRGREYEIATAR